MVICWLTRVNTSNSDGWTWLVWLLTHDPNHRYACRSSFRPCLAIGEKILPTHHGQREPSGIWIYLDHWHCSNWYHMDQGTHSMATGIRDHWLDWWKNLELITMLLTLNLIQGFRDFPGIPPTNTHHFWDPRQHSLNRFGLRALQRLRAGCCNKGGTWELQGGMISTHTRRGQSMDDRVGGFEE